MIMKTLFIAPITALLLSVSGAGLAASSNSDNTTAAPNMPGMMQDGNAPRMGRVMGQGRGMGQGMGHHGMMGQGMMGGGMMGMMGNCPMMNAEGGSNGKVMMQMRGEMMRAMGEIMIKYADKLEMPGSSN